LAFVAEHLRDLLFSVKLDHSLFLCCVGWQILSSSLAMGGDYTNANEGASQTDASSIRRCVGANALCQTGQSVPLCRDVANGSSRSRWCGEE